MATTTRNERGWGRLVVSRARERALLITALVTVAGACALGLWVMDGAVMSMAAFSRQADARDEVDESITRVNARLLRLEARTSALGASLDGQLRAAPALDEAARFRVEQIKTELRLLAEERLRLDREQSALLARQGRLGTGAREDARPTGILAGAATRIVNEHSRLGLTYTVVGALVTALGCLSIAGLLVTLTDILMRDAFRKSVEVVASFIGHLNAGGILTTLLAAAGAGAAAASVASVAADRVPSEPPPAAFHAWSEHSTDSRSWTTIDQSVRLASSEIAARQHAEAIEALARSIGMAARVSRTQVMPVRVVGVPVISTRPDDASLVPAVQEMGRAVEGISRVIESAAATRDDQAQALLDKVEQVALRMDTAARVVGEAVTTGLEDARQVYLRPSTGTTPAQNLLDETARASSCLQALDADAATRHLGVRLLRWLKGRTLPPPCQPPAQVGRARTAASSPSSQDAPTLATTPGLP